MKPFKIKPKGENEARVIINLCRPINSRDSVLWDWGELESAVARGLVYLDDAIAFPPEDGDDLRELTFDELVEYALNGWEEPRWNGPKTLMKSR